MSAARIEKTLCGPVQWCRDLTGNLVSACEHESQYLHCSVEYLTFEEYKMLQP